MSSIIDFIHDTQFQDLPTETVNEAVRCLADTLGVSVAGTKTNLSKIIRQHTFKQFAGDGANLWWDGREVSPAGAALANAMTIDSLDAHDGHKLTKGHVGCGVIPGLIAVMQAENTCNARELLTSIVIGYEIGTRAGIALHNSACDYHTSGAWIALATAALGARQLGIEKVKTREAVGIAEYHGPRSQMMRCIDAPTMVKDGSGWGAMAGVSAAYLAQDGFTGAPAITMEEPELDHFWKDLGTKWYVTDQYIKLYPVCRWAQPAVEAALALKREHELEPHEIKKITIETFHEAKRLCTIPQTTEEAQYSLPFSVSAALICGTISIDEVTENGLSNLEIRDLAGRIEITETNDFNAAFPARRFATAIIEMIDGKIFKSDATEAQGDPEDKVSDDVIWSKFDSLTTPTLGGQGSQNLRQSILEIREASDASDFFAILSKGT